MEESKREAAGDVNNRAAYRGRVPSQSIQDAILRDSSHEIRFTEGAPYSHMPAPFSGLPSVEMIPHLAGMHPMQGQIFVGEVNRAIHGGIAPLAAIGMGLAMAFGDYYPAASAIFVQNWQIATSEIYGTGTSVPPTLARHPLTNPTINVHIAGLPIHATDEYLNHVCLPHAGFSHARAIHHKGGKRCKGYGFAHFFGMDNARACILALNAKGFQAALAWNQVGTIEARHPAKQNELFTSIHVSRVPEKWDESILMKEVGYLQPVGARIIRDPRTTQSSGAAIIRFADRAAAEVAMVRLQFRIFDPSQGQCRVKLSQEWTAVHNRPSNRLPRRESSAESPRGMLDPGTYSGYTSYFQPKESDQTVDWDPNTDQAFKTYADALCGKDH